MGSSDDRRDRDRDRRKRRKREMESSDESDDDSRSDDDSDDRKRRKRKSKSSHKKKSSRRKHSKSKKRRKRYSSDSSSDSDEDSRKARKHRKTKVKSKEERMLEDLKEGSLEEEKERQAQKRASRIHERFGYTAEENPFNDPNLHETFNWTKKKEKTSKSNSGEDKDTLLEIDTIRRRRKEREAERDEMERLRAEESRMKELENYDEWARKEEEFHLEQQRKRSAIRLVQGREKPVDVLAKNLLLFGLTEEEKQHRAAVKYKERYNALDQLDKLEAELEEPHKIVKVLKLAELQELLVDIEAFQMLEREGMAAGESKGSILRFWDALAIVAKDEVQLLQKGGENSAYAKKISNIQEIFVGESRSSLTEMRNEIDAKLRKVDPSIDRGYWFQVKDQLTVHLAKLDLSDLHSKMLVRQLERLEQRKAELARAKKEGREPVQEEAVEDPNQVSMVPKNVDADFGNAENELNDTDEVAVQSDKKYSWQDRYAPRKPRYFNRVKTGYDWNKYNQTHYDHDNPPPKIVQGYKFNIFYPDLVDPTTTPQFFLEPTDSDDFCILRFQAGAPYEDVAFKIINREWNRSRKRGYKCSFERGVLSLYFNFTTHWYRR